MAESYQPVITVPFVHSCEKQTGCLFCVSFALSMVIFSWSYTHTQFSFFCFSLLFLVQIQWTKELFINLAISVTRLLPCFLVWCVKRVLLGRPLIVIVYVYKHIRCPSASLHPYIDKALSHIKWVCILTSLRILNLLFFHGVNRLRIIVYCMELGQGLYLALRVWCRTQVLGKHTS